MTTRTDDLFDEHGNFMDVPAIDPRDTLEWKNKLVDATCNLQRLQALRTLLNAEIRAHTKWYEKMTAALTDSIRFRSPEELMRAFKSKWKQEVDRVVPLDPFYASLNNWLHARAEERESSRESR